MACVPNALANFLHSGQPLTKLLRLAFQLVIDFSHLLLHQTAQLAVQIGLRQSQIGLAFTAIALDCRASMAGNFEHGHVLTQRMYEQHAHTLIARMHHGMVEQAPTQSPTSLV